MEIGREYYLNQLVSRMGNGKVKVISGIRGCGKSYLLFILFERYLLQHGVDNEHIIEMALDGADGSLRGPKRCFSYIKSAVKDDGRYYVLIDEAERLASAAQVLNDVVRTTNADIYVTADDCGLLTDAAAGLRGRGDEVRLYPLSFFELHSAYNGDYEEDLKSYMLYGGLPQTVQLQDEQQKREYLSDMALNACVKGVVQRNNLRSAKEAEALVRVLASSVGELTNPSRISNAFESGAHVSYTNKTVSKHIDYLSEAFFISKAERFDIGSRRYVGAGAKYYFTDIGLRSAVLDFAPPNAAQSLENIVYNELSSRGWGVGTGVLNVWGKSASGRRARKQMKVDFSADKGSQRYYIQLACGPLTAESLNSRVAPLCAIRDAFTKIVIIDGDAAPWRTDEGFVVLGMKRFLTAPDALDF